MIFTLSAIAYALFLCAGILSGFSYLASGTRYRCFWEDGTVSEEELGSLLMDFDGVTPEGEVLFLRGGVRGRVQAGEGMTRALAVLGGEDFAEIASFRGESLTPLARAALNLAFCDRLYYADGFLLWQNRLSETEKREGRELVVYGEVPVSALEAVHAERLTVTASALFDKIAGFPFCGFRAEKPYLTDGDALYLETAGGTRLLTARADAEELVLGEYDFADRGALLASLTLRSLELPFVGSSRTLLGSSSDGTFARLFSDGFSFRVPETLTRVKVRGGVLVSHAFYACPHLEEIDACGMDASAIAADAFADCKGLLLLHTPRAKVKLNGTFTSKTLPCGCTEYRRV